MQHLEKRRNICAVGLQAETDVTDRSYEDNTMIRIISMLVLAVAATLCNAAEQPLQLAENAPQRHIVCLLYTSDAAD